jgi:hypothetical protein
VTVRLAVIVCGMDGCTQIFQDVKFVLYPFQRCIELLIAIQHTVKHSTYDNIASADHYLTYYWVFTLFRCAAEVPESTSEVTEKLFDVANFFTEARNTLDQLSNVEIKKYIEGIKDILDKASPGLARRIKIVNQGSLTMADMGELHRENFTKIRDTAKSEAQKKQKQAPGQSRWCSLCKICQSHYKMPS